MNIYGLQKMTLLDFPGHVACTVFLGGCDFRCPFCHNYALACGEESVVMSDEELLAFLDKRTGLLDGVAITGGEPCLYQELPGLLARIKEKGFMTKLDTNGYHPALLQKILEEGLADYVAMDIKNSPGKYALTAGVDSIDMGRIRESIALIMQKAPDYEFRTTVVREFHEPEDFEQIGRLISGAGKYFLQPFTDRDSVPFGDLHAPSKEELSEYAARAAAFVQDIQIRGLD